MENKDKNNQPFNTSDKELIQDGETGLFYDQKTNETYYDKKGKYKSSLPAGFHPSEK